MIKYWILITIFNSYIRLDQPIQIVINTPHYQTKQECNTQAATLYNNVKTGEFRAFCMQRTQI